MEYKVFYSILNSRLQPHAEQAVKLKVSPLNNMKELMNLFMIYDDNIFGKVRVSECLNYDKLKLKKRTIFHDDNINLFITYYVVLHLL